MQAVEYHLPKMLPFAKIAPLPPSQPQTWPLTYLSPLPRRPGKTFQCNLAFKKLGIAPIVMSAGELESGNAGEPAKLIRQRYRWV